MSGGGPRYEPLERVPAPADLLLPQRLERIEQVIAQRTRTVTVVLDRLEDTFNMAAVLRTCEAFGLQDVHVIRNPDAPFKPNGTVTQGCDKWLDLHVYRDFKTCAQTLKARGYRVLASALREGATSLYDLKFDSKIALVFGNERYGVSDEVLSHCDGTFVIPMRGFVQSMNISAAASATISYAVGWRIEHLGKTGDLGEAELAELRQQFQVRSVRQRGRIYRNR